MTRMLASGESIRTTTPSARVKWYRRALTCIAIAGIAIALLSWFLRGVQIAHSRRILQRHESGHCPHCNDDISPTPDLPCPECGCDHRAARREAVGALERAARRAL